MDNYYPALGTAFFVTVSVVYLGITALGIWIGYLIMRTAVKNGILLADEVRLKRGTHQIEAAPTQAGWRNTPQGSRYWDGRGWSTPPKQ